MWITSWLKISPGLKLKSLELSHTLFHIFHPVDNCILIYLKCLCFCICSNFHTAWQIPNCHFSRIKVQFLKIKWTHKSFNGKLTKYTVWAYLNLKFICINISGYKTIQFPESIYGILKSNFPGQGRKWLDSFGKIISIFKLLYFTSNISGIFIRFLR